jgi:hypothetical protein
MIRDYDKYFQVKRDEKKQYLKMSKGRGKYVEIKMRRQTYFDTKKKGEEKIF